MGQNNPDLDQKLDSQKRQLCRHILFSIGYMLLWEKIFWQSNWNQIWLVKASCSSDKLPSWTLIIKYKRNLIFGFQKLIFAKTFRRKSFCKMILRNERNQPNFMMSYNHSRQYYDLYGNNGCGKIKHCIWLKKTKQSLILQKSKYKLCKIIFFAKFGWRCFCRSKNSNSAKLFCQKILLMFAYFWTIKASKKPA